MKRKLRLDREVIRSLGTLPLVGKGHGSDCEWCSYSITKDVVR